MWWAPTFHIFPLFIQPRADPKYCPQCAYVQIFKTFEAESILTGKMQCFQILLLLTQKTGLGFVWKHTRKPRSYSSLKLRPSVSLTRVKSRATSVAKKQLFWRDVFWDQSWLEKTVFTPFFPNFFQQKNYSIIFEEFRQLCAKFHKFAMKISGEIISQSWLLFTPFFNFPIVHWWLLIIWWE